MERHGGHLEEKPCGHRSERQKHEQVRVAPCLHRDRNHVQIGPGRQRLANRAEVGHGADPVEDREAVGQNRRTERAEQQVFHRAFVRTLVAPQESRQHVKADGHRFQAQEFHDQVVAGRHEHHADRGEKHQGVILAVIFVLELQITVFLTQLGKTFLSSIPP